MKMKKLKNKGIRLGTLIEIALLIAVLLVMLLPGGVVITPIGIPSLDSGVVLASPATERQSPDALLQQENLSGAVTDIDDDPDGPDDGNWLTYIDANTDTICRVSFPTPSGNPTEGADLQEFKIWVRKQPSDVKTPQVRIDLYENGSFLATILALTDVTSETGELFSARWNANLLGTADGSLVECYILGEASAKNTVEVGAVEWNVDYTLLPDISNTPDSWDLGLVDANSTYATGINYVLDESGFRLTNNSTFDVSITISASDMGSGWLLADSGAPDTTHYTLWAGTELTSGLYNIQVTSGGVPLITVLASNTRDWGLKLMTPTSFADGGLKSGTVTLTATQA